MIAGVLSDTAMIRYNRFPTVSFEERKKMLEQIPEVDEVVVQDEVMYGSILERIKPDYVIHGDNWLNDPMEVIRDNVIENLKKWGGQLIEIPYTYNEQVRNIEAVMRERTAMPEYRRKRLRQLLQLCPIVKTLEVHSGLTGLHFVYNVRTLERVGVSAVIIEDKTGLKKNSLFGTEVEQTQDSIENFTAKIRAGKRAQRTKDFMIIARIESLILEKGLEDALVRAFAYVDAGADGIVIYAKQLTRSAFPAMQQTATDILRYHRAKEVDDRLMSIKDIITLVDEV